ncbi:uncharacterized protein LOC135204959 [Macrobrachium nipponense]|uniref:uncharacterized protein LOC135204959 n=1 Tax=Macrobrachium nipponense TaxID=159736 RepID=UPI0030C8676D
MICQVFLNALPAFAAGLILLLRIVMAGGVNWRAALVAEFHCCDVARQDLLDFRIENRVRRILHSILNSIGLSSLIQYEEPSLSACDGRLQLLVRSAVQGAASEEVLHSLDQLIFWPKMIVFVIGFAITMLLAKRLKKMAKEIWTLDNEKDNVLTDMDEEEAPKAPEDERNLEEEVDEDEVPKTDEEDLPKTDEEDLPKTEKEALPETEKYDLPETEKEDLPNTIEEEDKQVFEEEDKEAEEEEVTEDTVEMPGPEELTSSEKDQELEDGQVENVDEVPREKNVPLKLKKEIKWIRGDLFEFPLAKEEKLILRKIGQEVSEFTKFYNVRLVLPEDDVEEEVAYLEGAENRVKMAFVHIQEILEEQEREGYVVGGEELDSLELSSPPPPPEESIQEAENNLNFAAILKRVPKQVKVKKQTFFIVQRKTFPVLEELPVDWDEEEEEDDMPFESDDEMIEEDDWEVEEKRQKVIVEISLREAPEEDGQDGMTRFVLKSLPSREPSLPPQAKEDNALLKEKDHQEEKVETETPIREKEEESDHTEEEEEEQDPAPVVENGRTPLEEKEEEVTLKEEAEGISSKEEQEETVSPHEEDQACGCEESLATTEKAAGKLSYANIAKILPEEKTCGGPVDDSRTKPVNPTKTERPGRSTRNWKTTLAKRCGPLKHCGGKTFSFVCEKDLDLGMIIGRGGKFAKMARNDHGVVMNVRNDGSRTVQLTGPKRNVEKVFKEIKFRVDKVFDLNELPKVSEALFAVGKEDFVMLVDQEFREAIRGPQDITLRKLIRELEVTIYLPDQNDERGYISIYGPLDKAQRAERIISEMIDNVKDWPTENDLKLVGLDWYEFNLGLESRRHLLALNGQGGKEIKGLFKVDLVLPMEDDQREIGFLGGDLKQVKKAHDHLQFILEEVNVRSCDIKTEGLSRVGPGKYRLEVEAQRKGLLVGRNGDNLRKIEKDNSVRIIVNKKTDDFVIIQGRLMDVEKTCLDVREAMKPTAQRGSGVRNFPEQEIVQGLTKVGDDQYRIILDREERAMVIGIGGQNIRRMTTDHKVTFQGPRKDETSKNCIVRGKEEGAVAFFKEVMEIVKTKGQKRKTDHGPRRSQRKATLGDFF